MDNNLSYESESGRIHEEKAPCSNTMKAIVTLGLLIVAFLYFYAVFGPELKDKAEQPQFILNSVVLLDIIFMWSFFSMKFRITVSSVEATMPPFKYQVQFSDIREIKIIDRIPWYVG